jgi:hypothetical protein
MADNLAITYGMGAVVPARAMKTYSWWRGGGGGLGTPIINLDPRQGCLV